MQQILTKKTQSLTSSIYMADYSIQEILIELSDRLQWLQAVRHYYEQGHESRDVDTPTLCPFDSNECNTFLP